MGKGAQQDQPIRIFREDPRGFRPSFAVFPVAAILWFILWALAYPSEAQPSETSLRALEFAGETNPGHGPPEITLGDAALTPGQAYGAEVLAYLLRVTLGMAGDQAYRENWRTRGVKEPLDYPNVVKTMTSTDGNIHDLMVLDPNILDLSSVLYHYDKGLSLYEGEYGVTSIYPASQFIAIRLLVLQKIHRKEQVSLSAILEREDLLRHSDSRPTERDLRAMNLTATELKFLREIIQSKPRLLQYLKSPFLVKALYEAGVVKRDRFVKAQLVKANYRAYPCRHFQGSDQSGAFKVFLLPSMTDEFVHGRPNDRDLPSGFRPTDFLLYMLQTLANDIDRAAKKEMEAVLFPGRDIQSPSAGADSRWGAIWAGLKGKYLSFYVADQRPFAVYPENAAQAVTEICPEADFTVIILGRNVHRSILIDPETDISPAVRRIYVDIMDIKHARMEADAQTIGRVVSEAMADRLLAE